MIKVSFIVPVYNAKKYLNRCIDSLLNSKIISFEIILVNDGSSDGSNIICDFYAEKYEKIKVIHKKNGGVVSARNRGVFEAKGEYFAFIDSDDWLDSYCYTDCIDLMDKENNLDIAIIGMVRNFPNGDEKKIFLEQSSFYMTNLQALEEMFQWNIFRWELCGKLYRRTLFENFIAREDIQAAEDLWSNWILFHKAKKIWYSPQYKYHYFVNPSSFTEQNNFTNDTALIVFDDIMAEVENDRENLYGFLKKNLYKFYIEELLKQLREKCFFFRENPSYQISIDNCRIILQKILSKYTPSKNTTAYSVIVELNKNLKNYKTCFGFYQSIFEEMTRTICQRTYNYKNIYVYGTGTVAKYVSRIMLMKKISYVAYVVSDGQLKVDFFMKKPVIYLSELDINNEDNLFILALDMYNQKQIMSILQQRGHCNIIELNVSTIF